MSFPVIKKASYILVNTPDMVIHNGTTQILERDTNPDSEYLKKLKDHLRTFDEVVGLCTKSNIYRKYDSR